jgi:hypothetical protein
VRAFDHIILLGACLSGHIADTKPTKVVATAVGLQNAVEVAETDRAIVLELVIDLEGIVKVNNALDILLGDRSVHTHFRSRKESGIQSVFSSVLKPFPF